MYYININLCPRTHLRLCRWCQPLGSRDSGRRPLHLGQRQCREQPWVPGARRPGPRRPCQQARADPGARQLLGGARVGRCHGLLEELALAFAMGTHERLGAGSARAGGGGGRRRSRRAQGKAPAVCVFITAVPITSGGARGGGMPVPDDAGGSGEAGGGGVRVEGRGRAGGGGGAAGGRAEDERGGLRPGG